MAISGPFRLEWNRVGDRFQRDWYRGYKAMGKPSPFVQRQYWGTYTDRGVTVPTDFGSSVSYARTAGTWDWDPSLLIPSGSLYVKAYDKFVSQAHGKVKASLAVSLVEIRESFTMIHKRAQQLINFGTALAKRDFGGVVRALGLAKDSTMRLSRRMYRQARKEQTRRLRTVWDRQAVKPRSFANNYLEFIFGWKPFVDDIASCIEVLQRSFESQTVRSRASSDSRSVTTKPLIWNVQPYTVDDLKQEFKLLLQAKIGIDNPNLLLANELGFINPVQVAWQVIPFSFLIDWFIPVGKFLGSYTDFVGLRVIDPFVSRLYRAEHVYRTDYGGMAGRGNEVRYGKGHRFYRDLWSLNVPTLKSRIGLPTNGLAGKAASSVALLIQQLSNRK